MICSCLGLPRCALAYNAVASSKVVEASLRKKSDGLSFAYGVTLCANNDAKKANSA